MSTRVQSRRPHKRREIEGQCSRDKIVLNVDLNDYPSEIPPSSWLFHRETPNTATSQRSRSFHTGRGPARSAASPIDVDAIEDDVVILSDSTQVTQVRNQRRRNTPLVIDIPDEDSEAYHGSSAAAAEALISISSNNNSRSETSSFLEFPILMQSEWAVVRREEAEKPKVAAEAPEEQPLLSCAICLEQLVDETSTTCGHIFCEKCIKTAIKTQKKCPTCRKSLTVRKIHRIYLSASFS